MNAQYALLVFAPLAAACGGAPDAAELYAKAGARMAGLDSFHASLTVDASDSANSAIIEIDLQPPDRMRYTLVSVQDSQGVAGSMTIIDVGGRRFVRPPGSTDFFGPISESLIGDVGGLLAALWTDLRDVTLAGSEQTDGARTYRLSGTVGPEVRRLFRPESLSDESGTAELWVGVDDPVVHRLRLVGWGETTTVVFSNIDDPVIIDAPADLRPVGEMF
jgi:hypothetical protein